MMSSDSDSDDMYSNFTQRCKRKKEAIKALRQKRPPKPVEDIVLDADDTLNSPSIADRDEESSSDRGEESHEEKERRRKELVRKRVEDAINHDTEIMLQGKSKKYYPIPMLDEAEKLIEATLRKRVDYSDDDEVKTFPKPEHEVMAYIQMKDHEKGGYVNVNVYPNETFEKGRQKIATKWRCDCDEIVLRFNGEIVDSKATPNSLGLDLDSILTIDAYLFKNEADEDKKNKDGITLKFQFEKQKNSILLAVDKNLPMCEVRELVAKELGCDGSTLHLEFDGEEINGQETAVSLELEDDYCIDVRISRVDDEIAVIA